MVPGRLAAVFNIQGSEVIIILLLALIVLGPEKLPGAIRQFTKIYGELRKMSNGFQSELRNALDQPLRELHETADLVRKNTPLDELANLGSMISAQLSQTSPPAGSAPAPGAPPAEASAAPDAHRLPGESATGASAADDAMRAPAERDPTSTGSPFGPPSGPRQPPPGDADG